MDTAVIQMDAKAVKYMAINQEALVLQITKTK
jgi:hypothetical protein